MIPTQKIRYIGGKQELGIVIDWKLVRKEWDRLKIPPEYEYPIPAAADPAKVGYIIDMSDRSRGKTTGKLILALILYKLYGIKLHYLCQVSSTAEPKMIRDLYDTVISCHYIIKIFGDGWNHISYYGKRWTLEKMDDDGKTIETDDDWCCICFGCDEAPKLKSKYNCPRGDMIFYDEFIGAYYGYNDFLWFTDLCKTIIRDRQSPLIFMSANTIDRQSPWFDEFAIRPEVEALSMGSHAVIATDLGTHIYIRIMAPDRSEKREKVNRRFWGFNSPRLNAISGRGEWATETFPHIPSVAADRERGDTVEQREGRLYLEHQGMLLRLRIMEHSRLGLVVYVSPASRLHDDSIVYTVGEITDKNHVFGTAKGTAAEVPWILYQRNLWYYSSNAVGMVVKAYTMAMVQCRQRMRV